MTSTTPRLRPGSVPVAPGAGPAGPSGDRPRTSGERVRSVLGHWNSAVTSYYVLAGASTLLLLIGLVMVLSSSSVESVDAGSSPYAGFLSQAQYALLGLPVLVVLSRLGPVALRRLAWPALVGAVLFQLLVFVPGIGCGANGNQNWVCVGGFSAQPSEAIKLALALWLGVVLARKARLLDQWQHAAVPIAPVVVLAVGVVLAGGDLGTAMVMLLLVAGALFIGGLPLRFFAVAGVAGAGLAAALASLSSNRTGRIQAWLSDTCDVAGACYQTLHGGYGLATGGLFGVGLGSSREKWSYLPEAHNDFIFAILGEELGLVGTLLVLALFCLLALAMLRVIRRHPDPFAKIVTGAVLAWIVGQALINIAVVVGLAPVIGVPLPLVSAGGSALIMTMAAVGVVLSFARTEPGAAEALAARPSAVRRSLAVIGRARG